MTSNWFYYKVLLRIQKAKNEKTKQKGKGSL